MARIRSVKPEIWMSPQVMNLSHSARLLFIGLITQADDEGRGSADVRRLKAAIFGGDDVTSVHVHEWLTECSQQGLVILYRSETHGDLYSLPSWNRHQKVNRPSKSAYPPPPEDTESPSTHGTLTEHSVNAHWGSIGSDGSRIDRRDRTYARACAREEDGTHIDHHVEFERIKAAYPEFAGRQNWLYAEKHATELVLSGESAWPELLAGVERYAAYVAAGGVSSPKYVLKPENFFSGADKPWKQAWDPPATKAEVRMRGNLAAAAEAKRRILEGS